MRQTREQRQLLKLQTLAQVLGLVDRFGPDRQTDSRLKQEQLLSAQQDRARQQALLPLLLEQQSLANQGAQADLQFAGEQRPLQLDQTRAVLANMGMDQRFNEQTFADRAGLVSTQAADARTQADFNKRTLDARVGTAQLGPTTTMADLKRTEAAIASQKVQDEYNRQKMAQEAVMAPEELAYRKALTEGQMRNNAMLNFDNNGKARENVSLPNISPEVLTLDKMFGKGQRYPTQTPEQSAEYRRLLPQLMDAMKQYPSYQWSPQSVNVRDYFNNGGVPYDPATGMSEEELTRLIGPLQDSAASAGQIDPAMAKKMAEDRLFQFKRRTLAPFPFNQF